MPFRSSYKYLTVDTRTKGFMVTCMCNMWRYGYKLPNTHAHGIDEHYFDFHLRTKFLQPTACLLPAYITSHTEMLALQFSLVFPGAVRRQCVVVVGRPTSRLGRCGSSRIKRTLQIITVVLSFKDPP
jgi:hypothetical protein